MNHANSAPENPTYASPYHTGISIRDWQATQFAKTILTQERQRTAEETADLAYTLADAMTARKNK